MPASSALCAALFTVAVVARAQTTHVVDSLGGPGVFTTIQAAVAAATDGDTILVHPTTQYDWTLTTSKGLAIVSASATPFDARGLLTVAGLPAGQQFVLVGQGPGLASPARMQLSQCAGRVVIVGARLGYYMYWGEPQQPGLRIDGCAQVSVQDSTLRGVPPLLVGNSTCNVNSCTVQGQGGDCYFYQTTESPAVVASGSTLSLTGTTVHGGGFFPSCLTNPNTVLMARPGLELNGASTATLAGGELRGGYDQGVAANAPSAVVDATSQLNLDSAVQAPHGISGPPATPLESGRLTASMTAPAISAVFQGPAGAGGIVALSLSDAPQPTPFGDLWLLQPTITLIGVGAVPLQLTAAVPAGLPPTVTLAAQGALLHNGQIRLSAPSIAPVR